MKNNKILVFTTILVLVACCKNDKQQEKIYPNLNTRSITSIIVDKLNNKWIGTDTGLFKSADNGYNLMSLPGFNNILSISYEKNSDQLWVGTSSGLLKASIGSGFSSSIIALSNLSNDTIRSSFVDSSSRSWFGSAKGISFNKGDKWKKSKFYLNRLDSLVNTDIETKSINSIASWDGDYYFATNKNKLYRAWGFNDTVDAFTGASQWRIPENGDVISDTMFVVFVDSKGRQWMGGTQGLQVHTGHYSKANSIAFTDALPNKRVHAISEAPDGKIWVGTENGITVYDGINWTNNTHSLPNPFITAIAFDQDGSAWAGTKKGLVNIK